MITFPRLKGVILYFLIFIFNAGAAQDLFKIREIFDFEIGDVFQYVRPDYYPDNGKTIKILSKDFSEEGDTLIYTASRYYYWINPIDDSLIAKRNTIKLAYTDLDSSFFEYKPEYKYDSLINAGSNLDLYDTLIEERARLCNTLTHGFHYLEFETYVKYVYGQGIGIVEEAIAADSPEEWILYDELIYYHKGSSICGSYDATYVDKDYFLNQDISFFPNPAEEFFYVSSGSVELCGARVQLFDFSGRKWIDEILTSDGRVDVTQLPAECYVVIVWSDDSKASFTLIIN